MKTHTCVLTKRGQVSVPADLRKKMHLRTGHKLRWESLSENVFRVVVEEPSAADPLQALGYGPRTFKRKSRPTSDWMDEIRSAD